MMCAFGCGHRVMLHPGRMAWYRRPCLHRVLNPATLLDGSGLVSISAKDGASLIAGLFVTAFPCGVKIASTSCTIRWGLEPKLQQDAVHIGVEALAVPARRTGRVLHDRCAGRRNKSRFRLPWGLPVYQGAFPGAARAGVILVWSRFFSHPSDQPLGLISPRLEHCLRGDHVRALPRATGFFYGGRRSRRKKRLIIEVAFTPAAEGDCG